MKARRVIIRKCEEYDPAAIEGIVRESMQDLAEKPSGRILIKPNVVVANTGYIHHAHTEPRMVEAMVNVLREREADPAVTIGESGGIGMPKD